jgi:L-2,4-diaminobutyrate decarboxylase
MDHINAMIRGKLLHEGDFYVVQTAVDGNVYLRTTLMNPFTDISMLETLLDKVEALADMFDTPWHSS